jgi:hypothetical protein
MKSKAVTAVMPAGMQKGLAQVVSVASPYGTVPCILLCDVLPCTTGNNAGDNASYHFFVLLSEAVLDGS